jgi:hypothetical protein
MYKKASAQIANVCSIGVDCNAETKKTNATEKVTQAKRTLRIFVKGVEQAPKQLILRPSLEQSGGAGLHLLRIWRSSDDFAKTNLQSSDFGRIRAVPFRPSWIALRWTCQLALQQARR